MLILARSLPMDRLTALQAGGRGFEWFCQNLDGLMSFAIEQFCTWLQNSGSSQYPIWLRWAFGLTFYRAFWRRCLLGVLRRVLWRVGSGVVVRGSVLDLRW